MFNYLSFGKMTCFLNIYVMTCELETVHITDMSYANNLAQRMCKVIDWLTYFLWVWNSVCQT